MAGAYYSTLFDYSVDQVWSEVGDFNDDRWSGEVTESSSENGKSGSTVGSIRFHRFGDKVARSDLRAYSAVDHFFTYRFVGTPPLPITSYQSTLRITSVIDGDRSFVEWSASFDCAEGDREDLSVRLTASYEEWLASLRKLLASRQ